MKMMKAYKPELIASQDVTRESICSAYLDMEAKAVVATNGHALVVCPVTVEAEDHVGRVPSEAIKAARKAAKRAPELSVALNVCAKVATADGEQTFKRSESPFPPWRQVMPKHKEGDDGVVAFRFNAHLLASLVEAMGSYDGGVTLIVNTKDDCDAIKVQTQGEGADAPCGVLMPMRRG